jgi:hypothetical protein
MILRYALCLRSINQSNRIFSYQVFCYRFSGVNASIISLFLSVSLNPWSSASSANHRYLSVDQAFFFTGFGFGGLGYPIGDVAILKLTSPLDFLSRLDVCTACITQPTTSSLTGRSCFTAGFGTMTTGTVCRGGYRVFGAGERSPHLHSPLYPPLTVCRHETSI